MKGFLCCVAGGTRNGQSAERCIVNGRSCKTRFFTLRLLFLATTKLSDFSEKNPK